MSLERCPICGCDCCPFELPCERPQFQPADYHEFCCAGCGCNGDSLEYARFGTEVEIDKGETNMDLKQYAGQGKGNFEKLPFLKAKDIGKGATVKIIEVREAPKLMKFSDILIDVLIGKKKFTWPQTYDSVVTQQLIGKLGTKTESWRNKSVKLEPFDWYNKRTKKKMKLINLA